MRFFAGISSSVRSHMDLIRKPPSHDTGIASISCQVRSQPSSFPQVAAVTAGVGEYIFATKTILNKNSTQFKTADQA
ncbi:hypothetical protein AAFF_G00156470 [Aldrovandia affinis]|uniref:Uncharacterized protein n=1 Tax=Aldrovandia affinis TaxID=143900 RepID=A0AAD7RNE9_9TELE|nr:hypothetical protein AAFF_G00156470 [Aldrovandia affinis]